MPRALPWVVGAAAATIAGFGAAPAWAQRQFDALQAQPVREPSATVRTAVREVARGGMDVQFDPRFGVPDSLWAADPMGSGRLPADPAEAARHHLRRLARAYGVTSRDVDAARVTRVHDTGRGAIIVSLQQFVDGVPVVGDKANVVLTRERGLVGVTGSLSRTRGGVSAFSRDERAAVATALGDLRGRSVDRASLREHGERDGWARVTSAGAADLGLRGPARVRRVLYRMPESLVPAHMVELRTEPDPDGTPKAASYVIAAGDGRLLHRRSLVFANKSSNDPGAFTYSVWADPAEDLQPADSPYGGALSPTPATAWLNIEPPVTAPRLVTRAYGPISTRDPWLAPDATTTSGNNATAYYHVDGVDRTAPLTGPRTFAHEYDFAQPPRESASAGIVHAFYAVNYFHDLFYDSGFDEASGNAQRHNFGRGGAEGDPLLVETNSRFAENNAYMMVTSDGISPGMVMGLWDGPARPRLHVLEGGAPARSTVTERANFGAQVFDLTADLAHVDDGMATTGDGCDTPYPDPAAYAGKVVLVRVASCDLFTPARALQAAGAAAVVFHTPGAVPQPLEAPTPPSDITVPIVSTTTTEAQPLMDALASGQAPPRVHLLRTPARPHRDSAVDTNIVAHEWGHYLYDRLSTFDLYSSGIQTWALHEGWADFTALLMTVGHEEARTGLRGSYPIASWSAAGRGIRPEYFGLRRSPYSRDRAVSGWTLRHVVGGEAHPDVPIAPGSSTAANHHPHAAGEVWAAMMLDVYGALIDRYGPREAPRRMLDLVVAAMKATSGYPTFLSSRDAVLMAAYASSRDDYRMTAAAFARRGAGSGARYERDRVTESFTSSGIDVTSARFLGDEVRSCDDEDGYLDGGETGTVELTLRNVGLTKLHNIAAKVIEEDARLEAGQLVIPPLAPGESATVPVQVRLTAASAVEELGLRIDLEDATSRAAGVVTARARIPSGIDRSLRPSTTDDFTIAPPRWTTRTNNPATTWQHEPTPTIGGRFFGAAAAFSSDRSLVSPPLEIGPDGLQLTVRHRWALEQQWDGGVVEVSADGGSTWQDVDSAPYTGTAIAGSGNPLGGRRVFTGRSPGYPSYTDQTIDVGPRPAGGNALIRFRVGTDMSVGDEGWDIDRVEMTGLTNTPFEEVLLSPDSGC